MTGVIGKFCMVDWAAGGGACSPSKSGWTASICIITFWNYNSKILKIMKDFIWIL